MVKEKNFGDRILHYSDKGVRIRQIETGIIYDDATDVIPCRYSYEETDIPIEDELTDTEALNIIAEGYE